MLTGTFNSDQKILSAVGLRGAKLKKCLYAATLFLAVFASAGNTIITTQKVAGLQIFRGNFFDDMSKNHTMTVFIYGSIMVVLMILKRRWKRSTAYKVGALFLIFAWHWALYKVGILTVYYGWFAGAAILDILGFYFWTVMLDRMLSSYSPSS
jgi:hypothetical protein